jgi:hypothetical protein
MISAQPNKAVQERLIMKLMEMPNAAVSSRIIVMKAREIGLTYFLNSGTT